MLLCFQCAYTYFKPADRCVSENHDLRWHDAVKRFFKCPCGQRAIALDRLPHKHCRCVVMVTGCRRFIPSRQSRRPMLTVLFFLFSVTAASSNGSVTGC